MRISACLTAACLAACTPSAPAAQATIRRERLVQELPAPFDSVTVTRTPGSLRVHLTTAKRCQVEVQRATDVVFADGHVERGELLLESSQQSACDADGGGPAAAVDIGVLAGDRLRLLGTTSTQGDLEIRLSDLDTLFGDRPVPLNQLAQLIVRGEKAAELPLGEIVNRQREIDARVSACEAALAAQADRGTLARRLAEVSDLKLQGAVDPRLMQCADQLYARMSEGAASPAPTTWIDRAKGMLSDLFSSDDPQDVPPGVKNDLDDKRVDASTFSWAISMLPTMCKITVNGGAAAVGQLVATGAAGIALSIVMSVLGDDLSDWLTNRCCEMAAGSLTDARSTVCHTQPTTL